MCKGTTRIQAPARFRQTEFAPPSIDFRHHAEAAVLSCTVKSAWRIGTTLVRHSSPTPALALRVPPESLDQAAGVPISTIELQATLKAIGSGVDTLNKRLLSTRVSAV